MPSAIAQSSVPSFQDALVAGLSARAALRNVSVVVGPPSPGVAQQQEWIALLDVEGDEKWASLGRLQREEKYKQQLYISVITRDGEGSAVRSRNTAYTLKNEVAQYLIENPTVGGTVWQTQFGEKSKFVPRLGINEPGPNGGQVVNLTWREAALYFEIEVKNRLQTTP